MEVHAEKSTLRGKQIVANSIWLIIFLLPWQVRWIVNPGQPLEYERWSVYGVSVLIIAFAVFTMVRRVRGNSAFALDKKGFWGAGIAVFWCVLSSFWAPEPDMAWYKASELVVAVLLAWLVAGYMPHGFMATALVGSAFVQAAVGIAQFFTQRVIGSAWLGMAAQEAAIRGTAVVEIGGERWLRAYGMLPHPNILGGYLAVGLLVLVGLILSGIRTFRAAIYYYFALVVITAGLFFSFSRSAWLATFVGMVLVLAVYLLRPLGESKRYIMRELLKIFVAVMLTFIVLATVYKPLVAMRVLGESRLELISTAERINSYEEGWSVIKDHWVRGVGAGNYTLALAEKFPRRDWFAYQPVHNVVLLVWAELGIGGFILCAALMIAFLKSLFRVVFIKNEISDPSRVSILAAAGALISIALVDHYLWSLHAGLALLALWIGLWLRVNEFQGEKIIEQSVTIQDTRK